MGRKQIVLSDHKLLAARQHTARDRSQAEMETMMSCEVLINLSEPHDPKANYTSGRPPYALVTMLRVHPLQPWYSLSDPAMGEALIQLPTNPPLGAITLMP